MSDYHVFIGSGLFAAGVASIKAKHKFDAFNRDRSFPVFSGFFNELKITFLEMGSG